MSGIKKGFNDKVLNKDSYNIFINGEKAKNKDDYLCIVSEKLAFPCKVGGNWQAYVDGMTDLSWINNQKICIIIYNWSEFLSSGNINKMSFSRIFTK